MSHLDEGTLHSLLDGELETHEVAEIQAHLGSCSACGLRLREVREFYAEADRLIASIDLHAPAMAASRPTPIPSAPAPAPIRPEPEARREPPPRPQAPAAPSKWEPWNEPPPMLLLPDNESLSERRMRRMRRFGWAAIVVVIAGAGFVEARKFLPVSPDEGTPASNTTAVVSQEETPSAKAPAPTVLAKTDSPAAKTDSPAPTRAVALTPTPTPQRDTKQTQSAAAGKGILAGAGLEAGGDSADSDASSSEKAAEVPAAKDEADSGASTDLATVRAKASEALAQLDRERRADRAAAATAALDAQKRRNVTARAAAPVPAAAPTPPPSPPTLEQRSQIYLRIGLDEASRQLGGPAHVIEGLSPLFMGLVQGGSVAGADGTRPVVRVVYQDSQGRLILLDQQSIRTGQATPAASGLSWTIGGTAMWLHGEAAPDILRTYRPRVR